MLWLSVLSILCLFHGLPQGRDQNVNLPKTRLWNYELNCVLQVPGLCITKLLDLVMLQDTRSAKMMCDERDLCQMFDYLHLLEGLEQGATVIDAFAHVQVCSRPSTAGL